VVARAAGISPSRLSRIELGQVELDWFETVAMISAAVGLEVSLRLYPGARVVRDQAQLRLSARLRDRLGDAWRWRHEVQVAAGDQRAWDLVGMHRTTGLTVVVEAETRVGDVQALMRRIASKRAASGGPRVALLVADTRANRDALAFARDVFVTEFPVGTRRALRCLAAGQDPGLDCLIVLGARPAHLRGCDRPVLGGAHSSVPLSGRIRNGRVAETGDGGAGGQSGEPSPGPGAR
jgi:transcriptional regulator with XRE-family HTH domain